MDGDRVRARFRVRVRVRVRTVLGPKIFIKQLCRRKLLLPDTPLDLMRVKVKV